MNLYLHEYADDYDLPGLYAEVRDTINRALPDGVSLHGDVVYGPYPMLEGFSLDEIVPRFDRA